MDKIKKILHFSPHLIGILLVLLVCTLVGGKYFYKSLQEAYVSWKEDRRLALVEAGRQAYVCPENLKTIIVQGGKVCRTEAEADGSLEQHIFDTYPFASNGKEQIYSFMSEGTIADADSILNGKIPIDRFDSYSLDGPITWEEDPYGQRYWRFLFYGFRPVVHLFYAFDKTNNLLYLNKASELIASFLDTGKEKSAVWNDFHAVSFRTMFLVKTWWVLRENNALSYEMNVKLLKGIKEHAEFLVDRNHYEIGHNHGVDEAAALYLVAVDFPEFSDSEVWRKVAEERLVGGLTNVVDADGVLIENSPYYHFYTLEKYWEIYHYAQVHNFPIDNIFNERLSKMITYASYILQPDAQVPLLGASLKRTIINSGVYKEITAQFSEFQYVLTRGKEGKAPASLNKIFPASGEVILRSGWGEGDEFTAQTQLVFDAGPYRTGHSDLDALSFSLHGDGMTLMPDAGLYTNAQGVEKEYFHGTGSHNAVIVDGIDQREGTAVRGEFIEGKDFASQSAAHTLYKGVTHERSMTLIGKRYVLIVDKLQSDNEHGYTQLFHLFPGAEIKQEGSTVHVFSGSGKLRKEVATIYQIQENNITLNTVIGQNSPLRGFCSEEYEKMLPCYSVEYGQKGKDAHYVTLISIGTPDKKLSYDFDSTTIHIRDSEKDIFAKISKVESIKDGVLRVKPNLPKLEKSSIDILDASKWVIDGTKNNSVTKEMLVSANNLLQFTAPKNATTLSGSIPISLDLSDKELLLKMHVSDIVSTKKLELSLSNDNWKNSTTINLKNSYTDESDNEWITATVGRSSGRSTGGEWKHSGADFDWSKVDQIQIRFAGTNDQNRLSIADFSAIPDGKEGEIVIIFDDGFDSILPAVDVMDKYGLKGNIAVIADRVNNLTRGYLSLPQLIQIQSKGWGMINHSEHHKDAFQEYYSKNELADFEADLVNGEKFLIAHDLNTTPNWYIYPHGATNAAIKNIVSKYYLFARTTINAPEAYPFGESFGVKTISADGAESSGVSTFVSVTDLINAVTDAKLYKQPLFITFHRIQSLATDKPGYKIKDFEKLMSFIAKEKVKVLSLNEFDAAHGITQQKIEFVGDQPSQLALDIKVSDTGLFGKFVSWIKHFFAKTQSNQSETRPTVVSSENLSLDSMSTHAKQDVVLSGDLVMAQLAKKSATSTSASSTKQKTQTVPLLEFAPITYEGNREYRVDVATTSQWLIDGGAMEVATSSLVLRGLNEKTTSYFILGGGALLTDYTATMKFDWKLGSSTSILARYRDSKNYTECLFSQGKTGGRATLYSVENGKRLRLYDAPQKLLLGGIARSTEGEISIKVVGNDITCLFNNYPLISYNRIQIQPSGSVGIRNSGNTELNLESLIIRSQ